jgi:hypothetical protein
MLQVLMNEGMLVCVFDECMVYDSVLEHMLEAYLGCMVQTLMCGLRHSC